MYDLVVIGGGPAGLAAASYARAKQLELLLIADEIGGKVAKYLRHDPNRLHEPLGADLLRTLVRELTPQMSWIVQDRVTKVEKATNGFHVTTVHHGTVAAAAIVVATGARPRQIEIPGSDRLVHQGLGYSITTYAHLVAGQRVAVIGTTARAVQGTAELARTAAHVFLIARDDDPNLGSFIAAHPNVEFLPHTEVRAIVGAERVEEVIVVQGGQPRYLNVQQVFVDFGLIPDSSIVSGLAATDADGFINVDRHNATDMPGLFVAGDVTTERAEQAIIALGDGTRAAVHAYEYLLLQNLIEHRTQTHA